MPSQTRSISAACGTGMRQGALVRAGAASAKPKPSTDTPKQLKPSQQQRSQLCAHSKGERRSCLHALGAAGARTGGGVEAGLGHGGASVGLASPGGLLGGLAAGGGPLGERGWAMGWACMLGVVEEAEVLRRQVVVWSRAEEARGEGAERVQGWEVRTGGWVCGCEQCVGLP